MMKLERKEYIINKINFLGEYLVYIYILAIFIESKLNLKIRYILEGFAILKILLDYKDIKIKGKEIYKTFLLILVVGIIFNYFASQSDGVEKFISRNIRFYHGLLVMIFINSQKKLEKVSNIIILGTALLGFGIFKNLDYVKLDIFRQRGIIVLGVAYCIIYFVETLKNEINIKKISYKTFFIGVATILGSLGVIFSDSRMGFLVVIFVIIGYIAYNLLNKFSLKKLVISFIIGISSILMFYEISPQWFQREVKTSFETKNNFSNEARIIMWQGCIEAFKKSPIIGVGSSLDDTGVYTMKAGIETKRGEVFKKEFAKGTFPEGHSIYLNFLAEVGSLTFIYLYLFFILIPKYFFIFIKNSISIASFFGIIGFYIYGITWSIWSMYGLVQTLFQIFLAILLINLKEEK